METKAPVLKAAWDHYYESLEIARQELEATVRFDNPEHRAQGYYMLMEAQAMAYNWVVAPRLNHPRIFTHTAWITYLYSIPANCPDIIYSILPLDGRYRYRLRGRYGDVRMMLMQVFDHPMGTAKANCTGNYEFTPHENGAEIDIILSATEQPGNWIPLDGESRFNMVIFRQFLIEGDSDKGELVIEMLDQHQDYDEASEHHMAERIHQAAEFMLATIRNFCLRFYDFVMQVSGGKQNTWGVIPGEQMQNIAGSSTCCYAFLPIEIREDEALIVEFTPPAKSIYWSFQLFDVWSKSIDFMHAQTDMNMENMVVDNDGKVRVVISLQDPGTANWLNPLGRHQTVCAWRNYRSSDAFDHSCQKVSFADIGKHLPTDTRYFEPAQRTAFVKKRRQAILKLYGD
jgi:hypothetical protein